MQLHLQSLYSFKNRRWCK